MAAVHSRLCSNRYVRVFSGDTKRRMGFEPPPPFLDVTVLIIQLEPKMLSPAQMH